MYVHVDICAYMHTYTKHTAMYTLYTFADMYMYISMYIYRYILMFMYDVHIYIKPHVTVISPETTKVIHGCIYSYIHWYYHYYYHL